MRSTYSENSLDQSAFLFPNVLSSTDNLSTCLSIKEGHDLHYMLFLVIKFLAYQRTKGRKYVIKIHDVNQAVVKREC